MYIKGNIRKVLYKGNNGYTVGLFKVRECDNKELEEYMNKTLPFVCTMPEVNNELYYTLEGNLINHPRFGIQFSATSYEVSSPSDIDGIILYLSSGIFRGVAYKTATAIAKEFGEESLKIIKESPQELTKIYGISDKKAIDMQNKMKELDNNDKLIISLNKMGFSIKESIILIDRYKENLFNILKEDFYSIKEYINFTKLDNIYLKDNEEDSVIRIKALIPYVINGLCYKTGDTLVNIESVYLNFSTYFKEKIKLETFMYYIEELNKENILIIEDDYIMLKEYYECEKNISSFIKKTNKITSNINNIEKSISNYEKTNNIKFNNEQKDAIKGSLKNNFFCITGGPGTGKTTIIKAIVDIYIMMNKKDKENVILLAPTGRSAKKMSETVKINASTIHKFLEWNKETSSFGVNEFNKSDAKLVIVDESSMIDIFLFDSLIKALKDKIKIILVGDKNQLPSISPGNVLGDILGCESINKIYLEKIYRTKKDSFIIELANKIKNKEEINEVKNYNDFTFIDTNDINTKKYLEQICDKYKGSLDDFQVLAPMYKGENGIDNLNILMQQIFNNNSSKEIKVGNKVYKENDKVIQLVNDVDNNVFNGDIGYIRSINEIESTIEIDFIDSIVTYKKDKFDNFSHAYAISIHKSQGSEYDNVVIILSKSFKRMFYNKLIYTAVTRAKKGLILIGELSSLNESIKNQYATNRISKLGEFLEK